jgi:hypothetical protein
MLKTDKNNKIIWRTRDGESIPIDELESAHLTNIIAFLLRQQSEIQIKIMLDKHTQSDLSAMEGRQIYIDALEAVAKKRRLIVPTLQTPQRENLFSKSTQP